jgi:hypothetical protein
MTERTPQILIRQSRRWRTFSIIIALALAPPIYGENLPDMRPALVGSGPRALVNVIDTQELVRKEVAHGAVFFMCVVSPQGVPIRSQVYGGTPDANELRAVVRKILPQARFVPAVYHHRNIEALFCGTVTFSVLNGKPHLRAYASQEKSELAEGTDFIAPQVISIPERNYDPAKYPEGSWWSEETVGSVEIELTVDATGQLKDVRAINEKECGKRFAEFAVYNVKGGTYLPAYRNGRPVASTTHFTYVFFPRGWGWK